MPDTPKYDAYYAEGKNALGDPFADVIAFFEELEKPCSVLDLGAGQGRDALPIARMGHAVVAVDISSVGLADLKEDAEAEDLDITTILSDLSEFLPDHGYDILLADRTFHMLKPEPRHASLARLLTHANPNAQALVIDEAPNIAGVKSIFENDGGDWRVESEKRGHLHMRRHA